ncbi:hypothetical protein ACJ5NV_20140, partial [Loktanella agnita]|uniref:hypothetical protein n=1 Tax=Loktanella agnita TaxID=287097 RepID=UPI00398A1CB1
DTNLDWRPTPHSLKHTAITWAIQNGASIVDAAGILCHQHCNDRADILAPFAPFSERYTGCN